jgi:hypothetical protein
MGSLAEKVKGAVDWLQRFYFVGGVLISLGLGRAAMAWLARHANLARDWETAIWLLLSGLLFFCLMPVINFIGKKKRHKQGQETQKQITISALLGVPSAPTFNAKEWFKQAYHSPVTAEVEKNIHIIAEQNQPHDREGFFARFIGVGLVAYTYDSIWWIIFKSQLLMLLELNRRNGWLTIAEAKSYYDKAAIDSPKIYTDYTFDQWLDYMKGQQLLLQHPSQMLEISVTGKDFLRYLTHWGRYPDARFG